MTREHFGITLGESKYGYKLNRDNFAIINNNSSFGNGIIYNDEWCQEHYYRCIQNFNINMERLSLLDHLDFEREINEFLEMYPLFEEVTDLNKYNGVSGYYMMVLDNYCQVYIGTSDNIKQRIKKHWTKVIPFDRVIFGNVESSIISIDSYRAFDTTRIYVYKTSDTYINEDKIIDYINPIYCCNRTKGGKLSGLDEAIKMRKVNNNYQTINENKQEKLLTVTDLTRELHCTRYKVMNYYAMDGLPLEKRGNKYVITYLDFYVWKKEMEERRKKEQALVITYILAVFFVIVLAFVLAYIMR